jgi:hypothetical protein
VRRTAVRHSQVKSLELLRLVSSPCDRVVPRDSILCLRSISRGAPKCLHLDELVPVDENLPWCELPSPGVFDNDVHSDYYTVQPQTELYADPCFVNHIDSSDMGEHVDAAVAADLKDEVCTTAGANIERHEDPEAVKPPTEAVPFPGGVCVASSPSVDATGCVFDDPATITAEQRLNVALVENPEIARRVMQLASDFQLSLEAEAAMLLMGRDPLSRLFDDEVDGEPEFRRRLQGLLDATARSQKTLWLVGMMDDTVSGVLDAGVKLLAKTRHNQIHNS